MKFTLMKTSDYTFKECIEINSLEELRELYEKYKKELIISFDCRTIEIYDDWRE